MSVYMLCFSPTGGTRRVADLLAEALGETEAVDLTDGAFDFSSCALTGDDVCLIAVPSFGGRVPAVALERLARVRGGGAAAVLAVAFGNRAYDDTVLELADAAKKSGFCVVAAVAASTEHSIMHQFGAGRPDARDAEELRAFGRRIADALAEAGGADTVVEPVLPGNRPFRAREGIPLKPKAGRACTACGACAKRCPVGAIPADDPGKTDKERCISCMRCAALCPEGARTLNPAVLFVAGKKMAKACAGRKPNELFLAEARA